MRKTSIIMGLAMALSLGAAGVASAQSAARPERAGRAQQDSSFRRGRGGQRGQEMLLKGITLSADQQARVKALRERQHKDMEAQRAKGNDGRSAQARQRGDTTGFGARRAQMEQRREQQFAELRSILNSGQRVQFDKNVAELKARFSQRGRDGKEHGRRPGQDGANQSR